MHDIAEIGVIWGGQYAPRWALVMAGVLVAAAAVAAVATAPRWWRVLKSSASWRFFMLAAAFGAVSQGLAMEGSGPFAQTLEEVLELDGALALCFSTWLLPRDKRDRVVASGRGRPQRIRPATLTSVARSAAFGSGYRSVTRLAPSATVVPLAFSGECIAVADLLP